MGLGVSDSGVLWVLGLWFEKPDIDTHIKECRPPVLRWLTNHRYSQAHLYKQAHIFQKFAKYLLSWICFVFFLENSCSLFAKIPTFHLNQTLMYYWSPDGEGLHDCNPHSWFQTRPNSFNDWLHLCSFHVALNCNPQSNNRTIMSPHAPISFLWGNSHVVPFRDNKEHLPYKLGFSQIREKLWMVF